MLHLSSYKLHLNSSLNNIRLLLTLNRQDFCWFVVENLVKTRNICVSWLNFSENIIISGMNKRRNRKLFIIVSFLYFIVNGIIVDIFTAASWRAQVVIMSKCVYVFLYVFQYVFLYFCHVTFSRSLIGQKSECCIVEEVIKVDELNKGNISAALGKQHK